MAQHRTSTWKQLLGLYKEEFLAWMNENGLRLKMFNKLAEDLEEYIVNCLSLEPLYARKASTADLCVQFANRIPGVFVSCDEPKMYDEDMAAQAYAHVHLLERYRRFWDALLSLLETTVLPMSDRGLEVLDVGTGPAPALYAVSDFYQALQDFACEKGYDSLVTPPPKLDGVESSHNMRHFIHRFSEISSRRAGPYSVSFREFKGLNFAEQRAVERRAVRRGEDYYDYETESWETWYESGVGWTEGLYRYNLVIFSNFLTRTVNVNDWKEELCSTFDTLRHGGVITVVGGSGEKYDSIYQIVRSRANDVGLHEIPEASAKIPCNYSDPYARRIKEHYTTIWTWIRENSAINDEFLTSHGIARKLWHPPKGLKDSSSPLEFTLLVFRKSGRPWRLRREQKLRLQS